MIRTLSALTITLALVLGGASAQAHGWATWQCTAIGIRDDPRATAPQRLPFVRSANHRPAAAAAALGACRASHEVKAGSCSLSTCWVP